MKWYDRYIEHLQHQCWEEEELPLEEYEDALEVILDSRESGGPRGAALRLEEEYGLNPAVFSERFS